MISVRNVSLTIKKTEILKSISIEFEEGKIHGLIGRNGSGKTMLMKCICGFVKPTEGEIFVGDYQIGKDCDFLVSPKDLSYFGLCEVIYINDCRTACDSSCFCTAACHVEQERMILDQRLDIDRSVRKHILGIRQCLYLCIQTKICNCCTDCRSLCSGESSDHVNHI